MLLRAEGLEESSALHTAPLDKAFAELFFEGGRKIAEWLTQAEPKSAYGHNPFEHRGENAGQANATARPFLT